jgi:outer membrane protein OmpA-like peptidoglycan-associated protein
MKTKTLLLTAAFAVSIAPAARAQSVTGFQADRFNPSERGSEWFALDTLDMRGDVRPAVGVVGEWASGVYRLKNADGSAGTTIVDQQMYFHAGASLVLANFIRLGINVPINVLDTGTTGTNTSGQTVYAPSNPGLGDSRIGADIRLVGQYGSPFTLALGGQYFIPTGQATDYTGDGVAHGLVRLQAAGESGIFAWALNLGYDVRAQQRFVDGSAYGTSLVYGAAAGLRLAERHLLIGPEIYGEANTANSGSFFAGGSTPVEALLGLHYTIGEDWRVGGGAGPGITRDLGSPAVRVLLSVEWVPGYHPPPPPPPPAAPVADRDGDGIPDSEDACPDVKGVKTSDPKTNGCPPDKDGDGIPDAEDACPDVPGVKTDDPKTNGCPADRDGDGIPDAQDACPDVKGVKTDDPKTNGCPPDRDGDGIPDAEDACPDVKGVKTDNPKTNGCPSDRDGDGIPDAEDACPDAPGPKTDDPKTNGCPKAAVVNGMIKISEQVKFATGSAKILKDSDELLGAVADIFLKHPEIKTVRIEGHTDNAGKAAANKTLSKARAESVKAWLVKHGIDKKRLTTQGFGQDKPIDDNSTEAGRKNNRRVEFHIEDGGTPAPANP